MKKLKLPVNRAERIKVYLIATVVTILFLFCLVELYLGFTGIEMPDTKKCMNIIIQLGNGYKK